MKELEIKFEVQGMTEAEFKKAMLDFCGHYL